jgi:nicotinate-nucleotide pyrophosphorylase (carboxylating)
MSGRLQLEQVQGLIRMAMEEDIAAGDVTSRAIFPKDHRSRAQIIAKEEGIFSGADMVTYVYGEVDSSVKVTCHVADGARVSPGDTTASIEGSTISMLEGERIALNFIQRISGIATTVKAITEQFAGTNIAILDTRKTLPGFRYIDKYAVSSGGGKNHRMGLFDMVMIKDNHIRAAGSITNAVNLVKAKYGSQYTIEVETTSLNEVNEALAAEADIIMLDNMTIPEMKEALDYINGRAKVEISGNVTEKTAASLRELKVDFISMGSLTHSVKAFDLSMKFL